jgi:rubredoxin
MEPLLEKTPSDTVCPVCHQPTLPSYYFCPNCGTKLNSAPLSTSTGTQIGLYAFSIILPLICFIFVTRWQAPRYLKSKDQKTRRIGVIASVLLAVSTIVTIWLAIVWTQNAIQSSVNDINAEMSAY